MSIEEEKTLLQTIRARLEWNEKGSIKWVEDENGSFEIISTITKAPLTKHFVSALKTNYDPYGNEETNTEE